MQSDLSLLLTKAIRVKGQSDELVRQSVVTVLSAGQLEKQASA